MTKKPITILGIETSCDETAVSVVRFEDGKLSVISNIISSQIDIHRQYGGVVPEVAAREHVLNIIPVIDSALKKAKIKKKNISEEINAIAVSNGPGLITSLIIGVETAKALSFIWKIPVIPINHIEGHIYANFIGDKSNIKFPAIILTVSGGHTMLVLMEKHGQLKNISETRDDAAGEAFDKAAKMLDIGYPGGPAIAKFASQCKSQITNHKSQKNIKLPRPMINDKSLDFSFSGLKTALLYELKNDKNWKKKIPEYAYEFEQAVVDVLVSKTIKAAKKYEVKTVMLSGGVSANKVLRESLENAVVSKLTNVRFNMPDLEYTTDNAAMMAAAGYYKYVSKKKFDWKDLKADCNLEL